MDRWLAVVFLVVACVLIAVGRVRVRRARRRGARGWVGWVMVGVGLLCMVMGVVGW